MTKPAHDLGFGIGVSVVALGYIYSASRIPTSLLSDAVGPGGFPIALGMVIALLGLLLALRAAFAIFSARHPSRAGADASPPTIQPKSFVLLLIGLGYILVAPMIGYFASLLLLIATTAWLGGAKPGWRLAAVSFCIAAVLTIAFVTIMNTTQPEGLLHAYFPRMGL